MKKNIFIKSFLLYLAFILFIALTACDKKGSDTGEQTDTLKRQSRSDTCPSVSLSFSSECIDGQRFFTFTPIITPGSYGTYTTYRFNYGDGTIIPASGLGVNPPGIGTIPTHVYPNTGTYTATLNIWGPGYHVIHDSCFRTASVTFYVESCSTNCPNCTVNATEGPCITGTDGIIRRQVIFTPNCNGPVPYAYFYNLQGGVVSSGSTGGGGLPSTITVLYQNPPVSVPTLTLVGPENCPQTEINIPYTFTLCPYPCPDITNINVNVDVQCITIDGAMGHNVTLTPIITGGAPASFIWSFSDGTPLTQSGAGMPGQVIHFYPTGSGGPYSADLTIIGTDGQICETMPIVITMSQCTCDPCATVTDIDIQTPTDCSQIIDNNWPVTFTATISGCPVAAYNWNFGDGQFLTTYPSDPNPLQVTHNYHCPHAAPPYHVSLTLVGCEGNPAYVFNYDEMFPLISCGCPTINDIVVTNENCEVKLDAVITGFCPDAITEYIWNFGDGTPTQTIYPPGSLQTSHTYSGNGNHWVTLTLGGVGSGCSFSKEIEITNCSSEDLPSENECFSWSWDKWYCWVFLILFVLAFIALTIALWITVASSTLQGWLICLGLFLIALLFAILLVILCHCCYALWVLYYLLLLVTIVLLVMAFLGSNPSWPGFFISLVLTIIVSILIVLLCGSCLALWILFGLFLLISLIFITFALCVLAHSLSPPLNFWLYFVIMLVITIILAILLNKFCGATICDFLFTFASTLLANSLLFTLVRNFAPCAGWLSGSTQIPPNHLAGQPYLDIPNVWFYTVFVWLIWFIVCMLL